VTKRRPLCRFQVSVDRKACNRPGYYFLRLHVRGKPIHQGCHAASRGLRAVQRGLGRVFGCRVT
jgi:hypothetical protein